MILALSRTGHGARNAVTQELDDGTALVWELLDGEAPDAILSAPVEVEPGWLMRHDRVDFPPGGVAYRHTHPGPGIRYLLYGSIRIDGPDGPARTFGPGEAWFEGADYPVLATATSIAGNKVTAEITVTATSQTRNLGPHGLQS